MPAALSRAESIFEHALDLPASQRGDYLDTACAGDTALRQEVDLLLHDSMNAAEVFGRLSNQVGRVLSLRLGEDQEKTETVGSYRLLKLLGRGGMGIVYRAQHVDDPYSPYVALKILRSDLRTADFYARFMSEKFILSSLDHTGIARFIGGGISRENRPYFVMEYVQGLKVDEYCDRLLLRLRSRLDLFLEICRAVQHAHSRYVVHRDLKPSNILVTAEGRIKLLDFGIAKLLSDNIGQVTTRTGIRIYTPEYAAPEQCRSRSVTPQTDVYQLGAVLYTLIVGVSPFAHLKGDPFVLEQAILQEQPEAPSSRLRPGQEVRRHFFSQSGLSHAPNRPVFSHEVKGNVDAIVLRALAKEPADRYSSVGELMKDVDRHMSGYIVSAARDTGIAARLFGR
ncbi:MAG TPA: serine/threonine-protein kinase [Rhodothermales bacterium]|nr:serine/threonine-protein kinase [Rhodothermales bacterium]